MSQEDLKALVSPTYWCQFAHFAHPGSAPTRKIRDFQNFGVPFQGLKKFLDKTSFDENAS